MARHGPGERLQRRNKHMTKITTPGVFYILGDIHGRNVT